jgi:hypothetical protein
MAIHEGDANRRLASQAYEILVQLSPNMNDIPMKYRNDFNNLVSCIEKTIKNLPSPGLTPVKMHGIYNATAVRYIKLLIQIEDSLHDMQ